MLKEVVKPQHMEILVVVEFQSHIVFLQMVNVHHLKDLPDVILEQIAKETKEQVDLYGIFYILHYTHFIYFCHIYPAISVTVYDENGCVNGEKPVNIFNLNTDECQRFFNKCDPGIEAWVKFDTVDCCNSADDEDIPALFKHFGKNGNKTKPIIVFNE